MTTFISQIVRISEDCDQNGDRVYFSYKKMTCKDTTLLP